MNATLLSNERIPIAPGIRIEIVIWRVPVPVRGSTHEFKYRIALIDDGSCVLRYDNEAGKGDHKHIGDKELAYVFSSLDALRHDFMQDVHVYIAGRSQG